MKRRIFGLENEYGLIFSPNGRIYLPMEKVLGYIFEGLIPNSWPSNAFLVKYGPDCLSRFNGMFALALWDDRRRRLFLARDRLGIKPLYFCHNRRAFIFASEIKAILAVLDTTPLPNHRLMYDFLTVGALDHTQDTFFESIRKVPPAHFMLIDPDGRAQIQRYWDFEVSDEVAQLSDKAVEAKSRAFFDLFTDAVRSHLMGDVPVGSCLSGGLDSSAIVSVVSRIIKDNKTTSVGPRQQTFSACYQNKASDERPYIGHVVRWTGAVSNRVFPDAAGFARQLSQLIRHQEEPFVSTSMYAQWEVMRLASEKGVTVLLDGQGADEQLLGYRKFYVFYIQHLLRRRNCRLGFREAVKHFGSRDVLKTLQVRHGLRYLHGRRFGSAAIANKLLRDSFARPFLPDPLHIGVESSLGERIKADLTRFSLPSLLRYEDKSSMAFSREARVPFLDHRLVEFVANLPLNLKLRDGWTKYCLRRGAKGRMPEQILRGASSPWRGRPTCGTGTTRCGRARR